MIKQSHPWGNFLEARRKAIEWMANEYPDYDNEEIARIFSMDTVQVYLIRCHIEDLKKSESLSD